MSPRRAWAWPAGLIALLAVSGGVNLAMAVIASRDPSFAVEADYYAKAVAWDATMAQDARNAALGWTAAARLEPEGQGSRLTVAIRDRAGRGLDGLGVRVEAFHNARAARRLVTGLTGRGTGGYDAVLSATRPGIWEVRVEATAPGRRYTATLAAELRPTR